MTTSPALLARLAPDLPAGYLQGLLSLKSMGAVVLVLALRKQLSPEGYYWYNLPKSAGFPFLALVEHTNFLSPEYFGGDHIIYIGDYLEPDHEYFRLSKEELLDRFLPSLARFNPDFEPDWVKSTWLFRTAYAQPIPLVNHSQEHPGHPDPGKRAVFCQHEPGLPVGPRDQFRGRDRPAGRADHAGQRRIKPPPTPRFRFLMIARPGIGFILPGLSVRRCTNMESEGVYPR